MNIVSIAIVQYLAIFNFTGCGYLQSSSLFQCQSSSDQSGLVYTPNIPDFYFNHTNAADLRTSGGSLIDSPPRVKEKRATHIFTIPPGSASRNCNGSLISIQYCYRARDRDINIEQTIFILSSLLSLNQHGLFEVKNISIILNTPRNSTCIAIDSPGKIQQIICCDTTPLSGLQIPSSEYIFGVTITDPAAVRPLAFRGNITQYRISQTSAALGSTGPPQGSIFTLNESNSVNYTHRALLLLRFIIGM